MRHAWILVVLCSACAGKAPVETGGDGGTDGSIDTGQSVTGVTYDYFGGVALMSTTITSDGIDPPVMTTSSSADGTYALSVPIGSKLFLITARSNYRPTRNVPLTMNGTAVMDDLYVMSDADVRRQYTSLGKTATTGKAFLAATLEMPDGTPLVGIPLANVTLVDAQNQPVTGVLGPYFFGAAGDIDATVTTATAYGNPATSRVAFLDVPPGTYSLAVTYPMGAGNAQNNTSVTVAADGATLAVSGGVMMGGTSATDPHFTADIYPRLQKAANGGLGCANCHTAGGPAAVLTYDDDATTVLANMHAATGVINTTTPAASLLLVRPLYEQPPTPQDHPNATFLDVNDPDYKLFLLWITNGAKP
jgi:hypothetical protein